MSMHMTDKRFARTVRRVSRRQVRRGNMNSVEYQKVVDGSRDTATVTRWRAKLEQPQYKALWRNDRVLTGFDFSTIWSWFLENWPTILRILLSLLVFLGEQPDENPSTAETLPKDDNDVLRPEGQV